MLQLSKQAEQILSNTHDKFGYSLYTTPVVDDAELFQTRAGDEVIQDLYTFERKGKVFALRPEFTTTAMQHYVQAGLTEQVRWHFLGHTFAESRVAGYKEQIGAGFELINADGIEADLEAIYVAYEALNSIGLRKLQIRLNHVGLLLSLLGQFHLDDFTTKNLLQDRTMLNALDRTNAVVSGDTNMRHMLDTLLDSTQYGGTMGGRTRENIVDRLQRQHTRSNQANALQQAISFMRNWRHTDVDSQALERLSDFITSDNEQALSLLQAWIETIQHLSSLGVSYADIVIDLNMSKKWDYYTGIVFDITSNGTRVASGGRYNNLATMIDNKRIIPAIGAAYYFDGGSTPVNDTNSYWIATDDFTAKVKLAQRLQTQGIHVSLATLGTSETCLSLRQPDRVMFDSKLYSRADLTELVVALKEKA